MILTNLSAESAAFSPDGTLLASAGSDGLMIAPITRTGLGTTRRLSKAVIRVRYAPDRPGRSSHA